MTVSSQKTRIDNRLLAVERLLRQKQHQDAGVVLDDLPDSQFTGIDLGVLLALKAEVDFHKDEYRRCIEHALRAAQVLADSSLNSRYARNLLVISKAYWSIGDLRASEVRAHGALAAFQRAGDSDGQVDSHNELARLAFIRCDFDSAVAEIERAVKLARGNPRKEALLTSNAARIRILKGDWTGAERDLKSSIAYAREHTEHASLARNLLSLGYLHLRKREFVFAEDALSEARQHIEEADLKRERIIRLEYLGELFFLRGDLHRAKTTLAEAYHQGKLLAAGSALVSQSARRLAEVELALGNEDDAMTYAQKALEVAVEIDERTEIAAAQRVIGQVFAARREFDDALEYEQNALEVVRKVGDPVETALTLVAAASIMQESGNDDADRIRQMYDEAGKLFKKLDLQYYVADVDYLSGVFACQQGDLSRGFKKLNRSEKVFASLSETGRMRRVAQFLASLSDQAVALSISEENEYRTFGALFGAEDSEDVRTKRFEEVLAQLVRKTGADRAVLYSPDFDQQPLYATWELSEKQTARFTEHFQQLLGEEISRRRPTLLLDCRRDPYINDLFADDPEIIASLMVIPFTMSDDSTSYIYLDRISTDGRLNPFVQDALNFAVGFSDVIALKAAEMQKARLMEDNRRLKAQLMDNAAFPNIITQNPGMLQMLDQVRRVVDSDISISIAGETGCGKDLLARAIHYNSSRRDARFISVNCAALPETLLESELFGHRRGAFTGADRDKPGLFEEADKGTFFLDEIADMPLAIQAKILRVLENREIVRLGETVPRQVDVRILSATNKDLKEEMSGGRFRQDLYYRLSALTFRLPPLRERREDIPLLVDHFLTESGKRVSPEALQHLVAYAWPGNVRELENEIKKLVLLSGESRNIDASLLSSRISNNSEAVTNASLLADQFEEISFSENYSLYDYLAAHERRFIIKALKERKGVKKHAAALLNIPESTLRLKIKEYRIDLNRLDSVN